MSTFHTPNAINHDRRPHGSRFRAEVAADGSVSLIADTPGMSITVDDMSDAGQPATTIELTSEKFESLHKMMAAPDKMLRYSHATGRFSARKISNYR